MEFPRDCGSVKLVRAHIEGYETVPFNKLVIDDPVNRVKSIHFLETFYRLHCTLAGYSIRRSAEKAYIIKYLVSLFIMKLSTARQRTEEEEASLQAPGMRRGVEIESRKKQICRTNLP